MRDVEQYHMPYFGKITIVDSSDDPELHGNFYAKVEKLGLMAKYSENLTDAKIKLTQEMKSHLSIQKITLEQSLQEMDSIVEPDDGIHPFLDTYKI